MRFSKVPASRCRRGGGVLGGEVTGRGLAVCCRGACFGAVVCVSLVLVVGCGDQGAESEVPVVSFREIDDQSWERPEVEVEDVAPSGIDGENGEGVGFPGVDDGSVGTSDGDDGGAGDVTDEAVVDVVGEGEAGLVDQPGPLWTEVGDPKFAFQDPLGFHWNYAIVDSEFVGEYLVESPRDEVVVLVDSVLVRDGVLRGFVQNLSEKLFARGVTVSVDGKKWVFPLTVQPAESVPFVVEGYEGPVDPDLINFDVAAEFVADPDPRRSFYVEGLPGHWAEPLAGLRIWVPDYAGELPPEGTSDEDLADYTGWSGLEDWFRYYETQVELRVPDSHPSIADSVMGQTINDLEAFLTRLDREGRVFDVRELVPYARFSVGEHEEHYRSEPRPVERLPFNDGRQSFWVGFVPDSRTFLITVGGAYDDAG